MNYLTFLKPLVLANAKLINEADRKRTPTSKETFRELQIPVELECERRIRDAILREFPRDGFLGEETQPIPGQSERYWVVDPLCGTINYLRGLHDYSISVAVVERDVCIFCMVYDPYCAELFHAQRGRGAFLNERSIQTSDVSHYNSAVISMGQRFMNQAVGNVLEAILQQSLRCRVSSSGNLELAYLACGRIDGYVNVDQPMHDYLAGSLLVCEAGGRATSLDGTKLCDSRSFDAGRSSVLCGNSGMHSELSKALANRYFRNA